MFRSKCNHLYIDPTYYNPAEDDELERITEGNAVVGSRNALILVLPFWLAVGVIVGLCIL